MNLEYPILSRQPETTSRGSPPSISSETHSHEIWPHRHWSSGPGLQYLLFIINFAFRQCAGHFSFRMKKSRQNSSNTTNLIQSILLPCVLLINQACRVHKAAVVLHISENPPCLQIFRHRIPTYTTSQCVMHITNQELAKKKSITSPFTKVKLQYRYILRMRASNPLCIPRTPER